MGIGIGTGAGRYADDMEGPLQKPPPPNWLGSRGGSGGSDACMLKPELAISEKVIRTSCFSEGYGDLSMRLNRFDRGSRSVQSCKESLVFDNPLRVLHGYRNNLGHRKRVGNAPRLIGHYRVPPLQSLRDYPLNFLVSAERRTVRSSRKSNVIQVRKGQ
ncbi:hypothetical protein [Caballeronia sp. LZ035]|uniref:hypothetical protein n=1 Tax=Caballeronia sp. LZ035 TaxID=3038568 RepID=UPI00285A0DDA|nr:hypothetical protein [Caballeronia sp. LZ035]MDR5760165.1 hypothetical protein [Caballeronia sp. LZ035]